MAWNSSPKVADCREIGRKWGYDQIVVLAVNQTKGTFETVSYGETKRLCDQAKKWNDEIHRQVANGSIEIDAERIAHP